MFVQQEAFSVTSGVYSTVQSIIDSSSLLHFPEILKEELSTLHLNIAILGKETARLSFRI
jgi:hypothetical protein